MSKVTISEINLLTPYFWIATFVRWTNILSSSLRLALYWTVQNLQNPSLYLKCSYKVPSSFLRTLLERDIGTVSGKSRNNINIIIS